jgi:hypothetical protein
MDVLINDVKAGKVDQMTTREIADAYNLNMAQVRRALSPMVGETFPCGTFQKSLSDLSLSGGRSGDKRPKVYVWFFE